MPRAARASFQIRQRLKAASQELTPRETPHVPPRHRKSHRVDVRSSPRKRESGMTSSSVTPHGRGSGSDPKQRHSGGKPPGKAAHGGTSMGRASGSTHFKDDGKPVVNLKTLNTPGNEGLIASCAKQAMESCIMAQAGGHRALWCSLA